MVKNLCMWNKNLTFADINELRWKRMAHSNKVRAEIMYHYLGGTLQHWWYEYFYSVLFIPLLRWYICISVVYFVSLR